MSFFITDDFLYVWSFFTDDDLSCFITDDFLYVSSFITDDDLSSFITDDFRFSFEELGPTLEAPM